MGEPAAQDGRESFLEACAGKLEGEAPEKRIIKEIEEELGYRIEKLDQLFELNLYDLDILSLVR
jgi:8-oxo-dGTP pyrophosphatase MutT (NUDIX family)